MKKNSRLLLLFLLLGMNQGMAQQKKDAYSFPVTPGTEAWKEFKTQQAMLDATQIPAETLRTMSTKGLVTTCLNYPMLPSMHAYGSLQEGFQAVASNFNGLQELLRRPDAGREIFKIYRLMDPKAITKIESKKQGAFTFDFTYVEMLLAQPTIIEKLTPAERKEVVRESFAKFKAKDEHLAIFGGYGEITSALVIGRVLKRENASAAYKSSQPTGADAMQVFLATGKVLDTQVINRIVADAQAFAK
ncbi:hypothetical protein [Hymenobacter cellulosilyticus]|uniref:DUF4919 domain-containing protein n=1 Tax=Hymenobacter cellulosilyticus TaxID=2932248 RepID=A0A8T9Q6D3_9BACT|nr:hypothetical protein [Hymenobacter cellulosilyticus]UOQ71340.1 hypothetical protein MUN79_22345 [Hymenobacter cellulosilyticus]